MIDGSCVVCGMKYNTNSKPYDNSGEWSAITPCPNPRCDEPRLSLS